VSVCLLFCGVCVGQIRQWSVGRGRWLAAKNGYNKSRACNFVTGGGHRPFPLFRNFRLDGMGLDRAGAGAGAEAAAEQRTHVRPPLPLPLPSVTCLRRSRCNAEREQPAPVGDDTRARSPFPRFSCFCASAPTAATHGELSRAHSAPADFPFPLSSFRRRPLIQLKIFLSQHTTNPNRKLVLAEYVVIKAQSPICLRCRMPTKDDNLVQSPRGHSCPGRERPHNRPKPVPVQLRAPSFR